MKKHATLFVLPCTYTMKASFYMSFIAVNGIIIRIILEKSIIRRKKR